MKIFKFKSTNKKKIISRQCVPQCGMVPLVSRSPSLAILLYFPAWIPSKGSNTQLYVSMACDSTRLMYVFGCLFQFQFVRVVCMYIQYFKLWTKIHNENSPPHLFQSTQVDIAKMMVPGPIKQTILIAIARAALYTGNTLGIYHLHRVLNNTNFFSCM